MAFCKVMIIGNRGRDPEMRYTPTGRPVTQFSVAVNQSTKNQQTREWVEETHWLRVSVFGDRAGGQIRRAAGDEDTGDDSRGDEESVSHGTRLRSRGEGENGVPGTPARRRRFCMSAGRSRSRR